MMALRRTAIRRKTPLRRAAFGRKPSKYHAKKVSTPMGVFDSKLERERYNELALLQTAGHISELSHHPKRLYLSRARISYQPDFFYKEKGRNVFEESKGFDTDRWRIIQKLWQVYGPALLRITKRASDRKIRTVKEIMPTG